MRFPIEVLSAHPLWDKDLLISKLDRVGLTLARLRAYSKHLTAASLKLWYRLASTVGTLLNDVSMNMACSWILNALFWVSFGDPFRVQLTAGFRCQNEYSLECLAMKSLAWHFCQIHRQRVPNICRSQVMNGRAIAIRTYWLGRTAQRSC